MSTRQTKVGREHVGLDAEGKVVCRECGRTFHLLGYHLCMKHEMTTDEYRRKYRIPDSIGLTSRDLHKRKQSYMKAAIATGDQRMTKAIEASKAPGVREKATEKRRKNYREGRIAPPPSDRLPKDGRSGRVLWGRLRSDPEAYAAFCRNISEKNDRGKRVEGVCEVCGTAFVDYPQNRSRYCSQECYLSVAGPRLHLAFVEKERTDPAFKAAMDKHRRKALEAAHTREAAAKRDAAVRAHYEKTLGPPEHGTQRMYGTYGCRCEVCRAGKNERHRAYLKARASGGNE
jgi:hypothetical protein